MSKYDYLLSYKSVARWLGRRDAVSHPGMLLDLGLFVEWLKDTGGALSGLDPDGIVSFQQEDKGYEVLDLVQDWVGGLVVEGGEDAAYGTRQKMYSQLRSFFLHNRAALPADRSFKVRSGTAPVKGSLTYEDFGAMLNASNPLYRVIFVSVYYGGMDWGALNHWNLTGAASTREQLETGEKMIKVELPGRKHSRNKKPFYTLVGGHAVRLLGPHVETLSLRCPYLFVNQVGHPLRYSNVRKYWIGKLEHLRLVARPPRGERARSWRSAKNFHKIRRVFKTRTRYAVPTGYDMTFTEFFMGHDIDPLNYDEIINDVGYARAQYAKALPYLDPYEDATKLSVYEAEDIRERLRRLEEAEDRRRQRYERLKRRRE